MRSNRKLVNSLIVVNLFIAGLVLFVGGIKLATPKEDTDTTPDEQVADTQYSCSDVQIQWNYGTYNQILANTQIEWAGKIASVNGYPRCVLKDSTACPGGGCNPANWRVAVYNGSISDVNSFISRQYNWAGDITAITTAPSTGEFYTLACIAVVGNGNESPIATTAPCKPVRIVPAASQTPTPSPQPSTSVCGNGTIDSGEQCDPGASGNTCGGGRTCSGCSCVSTSSTLPSTAISARDVSRLALGSFLILLGFILFYGSSKKFNNINFINDINFVSVKTHRRLDDKTKSQRESFEKLFD